MKQLLMLSLLLFMACSKTMRMTKTDNNKCVLSIKKTELIIDEDVSYYNVPVTLTNTSDKTLNYYSLSCSWQDNYDVNNDKLYIEHVDCDKNSPIWLKIPSGKSETVFLKLILKKPLPPKQLSFKIGFNLIKLDKKIWEGILLHEPTIKNQIWSNEITLSQ